jgi:hypothetical protein
VRNVTVTREANAPNPVTAEYRIGSGSWTSFPSFPAALEIPASLFGTTIRFRTQSASLVSHTCTISGAATASRTGTGTMRTPSNTGVIITNPAPGAQADIQVSCANAVPNTNPTTRTYRVRTLPRPDLLPIVTAQAPTGPDHITGTWASQNFSTVIHNIGGVVQSGSNIPYKLQWRRDGVGVWQDVMSGGYTSGMAAGSPGTPTIHAVAPTLRLTNVPFGVHSFRVGVNRNVTQLSGNSNNAAIGESAFANNISTFNATILPPDPVLDIDMRLGADSVRVVRSGSEIDVVVRIEAGYALTCTLTGLGISTQIISHDGTTPIQEYTYTTSALNNKALYTLNCTGPMGITPGTSNTVDVTPVIQEI